MPVYLFTYHAYGSWMPDHKRGYTQKKTGIQPTDPDMSKHYRDNQKQHTVEFTVDIQHAVIEEIQTASKYQRFQLYMIATDPTHIHALCGWDDARPWDKIRNGIRESLTRMMNQSFTRRRWLAENASRKHVKDEEHFNHLRENYLPDHRGLKWRPDRGTFQ